MYPIYISYAQPITNKLFYTAVHNYVFQSPVNLSKQRNKELINSQNYFFHKLSAYI